MSGIKAKRKQLVRKTLMRAKTQGERAEQRQELPEEYAQTEVQQGIYRLAARTGNTAKSTARISYRKFRAMQSGKISPCRAAPNLHQNRLKKRKSLFPRRPSAGKCSKKEALPAKRPSQPKTPAPQAPVPHRPPPAPPPYQAQMQQLKATAPDPRGCAPLSAKADGCHSGGQYRSHRYPRTQAAHNQQ